MSMKGYSREMNEQYENLKQKEYDASLPPPQDYRDEKLSALIYKLLPYIDNLIAILQDMRDEIERSSD
jgi:hypothetical protein